jgi:transposase
LASLSGEAADGLGNFIDDLRDALADGRPVAGADETSVRVAGSKWWFHVCCTALRTFLGVHRSRGIAATDDLKVLPRFKGTLIHDRWAPYWHYSGMRHAVCCAHNAEPAIMRCGRQKALWQKEDDLELSA